MLETKRDTIVFEGASYFSRASQKDDFIGTKYHLTEAMLDSINSAPSYTLWCTLRGVCFNILDQFNR